MWTFNVDHARTSVAQPSRARGPGQYFAQHPVAYGLSVAGSTFATAYAAVRAANATGARRVPWLAMAVLEAAITAGIINACTRSSRRR
jgi:hypothetical protein